MNQYYALESHRLFLRQWTLQDLPKFYALNSDAETMQYFPDILSRKESDQLASRCKAIIASQGWGFWAAEEKATGKFVGLIGLHKTSEGLPFAPCIEVGWRLCKAFWGMGYATEAAQEALTFAFNTLKVSEVVSFTAVQNMPSQRVMHRLGMKNTNQNFIHPKVPKNHRLAEHVLFKISAIDWKRLNDEP